jgi:hypothetical protein
MDYLNIKTEIEATSCPVHNIRPLAKIVHGRIALRCCCDKFTRICMAELDRKMINNKVLFNIVDAWEAEHFVKSYR